MNFCLLSLACRKKTNGFLLTQCWILMKIFGGYKMKCHLLEINWIYISTLITILRRTRISSQKNWMSFLKREKRYELVSRNYASVRPFRYFDRCISASLLRPLYFDLLSSNSLLRFAYFDLLSNLDFLLVETYRPKYSSARSKDVVVKFWTK